MWFSDLNHSKIGADIKDKVAWSCMSFYFTFNISIVMTHDRTIAIGRSVMNPTKLYQTIHYI